VDASEAEDYAANEGDAFKNAVSVEVAKNAKSVLALLNDPVIAARVAKL